MWQWTQSLLFSIYRFYFKTSTDDRECEVVYEEVKDDNVVLPTYDGKVVGKVERVDS